jgi:hypothetical protein
VSSLGSQQTSLRGVHGALPLERSGTVSALQRLCVSVEGRS